MIVTIEPKAKPCPGVKRALGLAEDVLRRGEALYSMGQLIHNRREMELLQGMGLRRITLKKLDDPSMQEQFSHAHFLVRTHGESEEVLQKVRECRLKTVDATCPIVCHSQEIVDKHVREGWGIVITGNKEHPEVIGLLARTKGCGVVISSGEEAENQDLEDRSLLLAQTTIDPDLFSKIRRVLSGRLSNLKIVDTTCRFLRNRQNDISAFCSDQDVVILIGGQDSSNCRLLHKTALEVNERAYKIEGPEEVEEKWFLKDDHVGITGGASTPRWQLEEMKSYFDNHKMRKNPKGLINRKGGTFSWWKRKNRKTPE